MPVLKPKVYIETTIPSFYYSGRTEPDMIARQDWTREWWDTRRDGYELVTSDAVKLELERRNHPSRDAALELIKDLAVVSISAAVVEIEEAYIAHAIMPRDPFGDAMHLAIAAYYKCDYLLTWNCAHLANPNKVPHLKRINGMLGLFSPTLVTPMELLAVEANR